MRHHIWIGLSLCTLALAACDVQIDKPDADEPPAESEPLTPELAAGEVVETKQLVIEPARKLCYGWEGPRTCLDSPDDDVLYDHIWGFTHEWGHRYTIQINVVKMPEDTVDGDGSIWNYELVELIDDQLDTAGELELPAALFVIAAGAESGTLVDGTPIVCAPELCDAIAAVADPDDPESPPVVLSYGAEQPLPLVAEALLDEG